MQVGTSSLEESIERKKVSCDEKKYWIKEETK